MKKMMILVLFVFLMFPVLVIAAPETPDNFDVTADKVSLIVTWTANQNSDDDEYDDTDGYFIYYWVTNDTSTKWRVDLVDESESSAIERKLSHTISGLTKNTKYTVEIYAYTGNGDSVSVADDETITTNDVDVSIDITDVDEISVSIDADGSNISTFSVMVGTSPGASDVFGTTPVNIDKDESQVVTGLENGTYFVTVTLSDGDVLPSVEFSFEDTHTFISQNGNSIENGCFVANTNSQFKIASYPFIVLMIVCILLFTGKKIRNVFSLLVLFILIGSANSNSNANDSFSYKNTFGFKGGWFEATEKEQQDVYENITPFSIFYERMLTNYISVDIDLGYSKSDGTALTESTGSTELPVEFEMYPSAASVNFNYDLTSYLIGYIGVGGDWWLVEEKSSLGDSKNEVGGWHAKTGVKLFSDELDTFKQVGCLLEVSYTQLDRFGQNDIDLGGWKFNFGLMYCL